MKLTVSRQPLPLVKTFSDEWAILRFLKRWTPEDMRRAIDGDVDLAELMPGNWAKVRLISGIVERNREAAQGYLSPENVLYWFSVRRPDLYFEIIRNPAGRLWLTNNFIKIRDALDI